MPWGWRTDTKVVTGFYEILMVYAMLLDIGLSSRITCKGVSMVNIVPILFLAILVTAFGLLIVWGTSKLGPKTEQSLLKKKPYECGIESQSTGQTKISVKFYLTAILFILFDIEIVFMYPWAISYADAITDGYGLQVLLGMGVFILIFIIGLFWEVKSKALEWD